MFLANYSDGLSDLHLPDLIDSHNAQEATASCLSVPPTQTFHAVTVGESGCVQDIRAISEMDVWMNAGFFVLNQEIFQHLHDGEELVVEPFERLIQQGKLNTLQYDGFFGCMDTYKEKQMLDDMHAEGFTPWKVWKQKANSNSQKIVPLVDGKAERVGLSG